MNWDAFHHKMSFASLVVLSLGIFTGVSFTALSHILIFIPGVYFFLKYAKDIDFKKINLSIYFMDLICLSIVISIFVNWTTMDEPHRNLFKVKYFLLAILSIFAYRETFKHYMDDKKISLLLHLFILATTVATLSGLVGLFTGFNPLRMGEPCHPSRACGLYGMTMTYGYGISLFMVLITGAILYRRELEKYISPRILYAAWIINLLGLYFSFARGGWLSFLAAVPFFFFKEKKRTFLSVMGGGLLALSLAFILSPSVREMFLKRTESNNERIASYQTALQAFREKPVWGWGYRNFEPHVLEIKKRHGIAYPEFSGHAHNNFLEHLASTGIVGFMALFLFHFYWSLESFRGTSLISRLSFPFCICFIVGGLPQYTFGDGENLFLILNLWAIGQVGNMKSIEERANA